LEGWTRRYRLPATLDQMDGPRPGPQQYAPRNESKEKGATLSGHGRNKRCCSQKTGTDEEKNLKGVGTGERRKRPTQTQKRVKDPT